MKEKIKSIINKMLENGYEEDDPVVQLLEKNELKWDNPEQVYCLHCFTNAETLKSALKRIYPECKQINNLAFLFQNYFYLENQIKSALSDFAYQGAICDKARWVLKQWFKILIEEDAEDIVERQWYHPNFGNRNFWMQFCEVSTDAYYHGFTDENMEFMKVVRKIAKETCYG